MSSASDPHPPLELEEPIRPFDATPRDDRPHIPDPLPVRLVAVDDVRLPAPAGVDAAALDAFYVALLEFQRIASEFAYQAENFVLRFDVIDGPIVHESLRPLGIEVLSLAAAEKKVIAAELEYTRQRGLTPGSETLLLLDPAGNWIEVGEIRLVA